MRNSRKENMKSTTGNRKWAKELLAKINHARTKANNDQRSKAEYWNGDNWGSMSGIKDAINWVDNQIIDCIIEHATPKVKPCG